MATIENRSRIQISVKRQPALTKHFPFNKTEEAKAHRQALIQRGLEVTTTLLDEAYLVRYRLPSGKRKSFTAASEGEAVAIKQRIESDQYHMLFVDYSKAHQLTLADLLIRYLKEEAPRTKGFLVTAYQINSWLQDAGLPRQDIAAIHAAHPNPKTRDLRIPKSSGRRMSMPSDAVAFIRNPFASIEPEDLRDFIDERLQSVEPATVDRELDVFRAVCTAAMKKWRININRDPFDGVVRPEYINERNRRLRGDEEERLQDAAHTEDRLWTARVLGDTLFAEKESTTKYQRIKALSEAREVVKGGGMHVPMFSTFIDFQLMTAARRSETLKLTWEQIDLDAQTAFLPETKNGRPRTLPLRSELVERLREFPRTSAFVFPIPVDYLRNAWHRICTAAGIVTEGDDRLRLHDLRHEAISRVAEAGSQTPGGFSLLDLQAFSGHRDPRMLMRYAHLTPTGLAKRLDAAFTSQEKVAAHHGRRRLPKELKMTMSDVMVTPMVAAEPAAQPAPMPEGSTNDKVVQLNAYRRTA